MSGNSTREPWNVNRVVVVLSALLIVGAVSLFGAGDPGAFMPFLPGILAAAVLAFWSRPWLYLVAGILLAAFPLVILFVFGAHEALKHPVAGVEYMGLSLALGAAVLALVGGIAGFVQGRRGAQPALRGGLATPQGAFAVLAIGLLVGMTSTGALASADVKALMESPASNVVPEETVSLATTDFAFSPAEVTIPVGKLVALEVKNEDPAVHTFTWHDGDGKERTTVLPAKSTVTILMKFDEPQRIHFWCAPHSGGAEDMEDGSMWGTLVAQ